MAVGQKGKRAIGQKGLRAKRQQGKIKTNLVGGVAGMDGKV
jgi:hypothetical protein